MAPGGGAYDVIQADFRADPNGESPRDVPDATKISFWMTAIHLIRRGAIVCKMKKADLKGVYNMTPKDVRIEFVKEERCDVRCKDELGAKRLVEECERYISDGQGKKRPRESVPSPVRSTRQTLQSDSAKKTTRHDFDDPLASLSQNSLSKVGGQKMAREPELQFPVPVGGEVSTPPPTSAGAADSLELQLSESDAKRARINAQTGSLPNGRGTLSPPKGRRPFQISSTRPQREYSKPANPLYKYSTRSFSSTPQTSSSYGGYRQNTTFGLANLGNTCYMNAVMQAFCSLREFVADLLAMPQSIPQVQTGRLWSSSVNVLQKMNKVSQSAWSPADLQRIIGQAAPMFAGNQQQDAHEFFLEYINQLHDELLSARKAWLEGQSLSEDEEPLGLLATQAHMDSEVRKTLHCAACQKPRDTCERFRDFSLDFPEGLGEKCDLTHLMREYFKPEVLTATCEHCKHPTANMQKHMTQIPRVLVLHLKRFTPNFKMQRYDKCHQYVDIPMKMDLSKDLREFYAPDLPDGSSSSSSATGGYRWEVQLQNEWREMELQEAMQLEEAIHAGMAEYHMEARGKMYRYDLKNRSAMLQINEASGVRRSIRRQAADTTPTAMYSLRSIISHEGISPHSGHYVCYAQGAEGKWSLYNDSRVTPVGDPRQDLGRKAYILCYVLHAS